MSRAVDMAHTLVDLLRIIRSCCALVAICGCCVTRETPWEPRESLTAVATDDRVVVKRGTLSKTHKWVAAVVQFPGPWLRRYSKHPERFDWDAVAEQTAAYLEQHGQTDVIVLVNDHDPAADWRRLRENHSVSPIARYSLGAFDWTARVLLPPRVWGYSHFDPFSNSLYLGSDSVPMAMYQAAFAARAARAKNPAAVSAVGSLPLLGIWHQRRCTQDLVAYAQDKNDWGLERDVYEVVYPEIGAEHAGPARYLIPVWWAGPAVRLGGATVGRIAGWSVIQRREAEREAAGEATVVDQQVELATFHEPSDTSMDERSAGSPSAPGPLHAHSPNRLRTPGR